MPAQQQETQNLNGLFELLISIEILVIFTLTTKNRLFLKACFLTRISEFTYDLKFESIVKPNKTHF